MIEMPIGLDYTSAIHQSAGIGRYTRELVNALVPLAHTKPYHLFVADAPALPPPDFLPPAWRWCPTRISRRWLERMWYRLHVPLPVEWWTGRVGIFHQPDFVLPPTLPKTRTIVTIHDLSYVRLPEFTMPGMARYLNRWVPHSVERADMVIAVSEATRQDLIELYHTPPAKIITLYHGLTSEFAVLGASAQEHVRQKYGLANHRFILSVGTVQPRKNYQRLVQAFAHLYQTDPDLLLVLVGGQGWQGELILNEIKRQRLEPQVRLLGFVEDADLPALYNAATVFAYPSLYEGFGLPVLEAMACGTPVVASNVSALPEVVGEAALLVDPYDVTALTEALAHLLNRPAEQTRLAELGQAQARRFSWGETAAKLVALYQQLAT